jgi:hypothetical protein
LGELEDQAVENYLDDTDFDAIDWLNTTEEKKNTANLKT